MGEVLRKCSNLIVKVCLTIIVLCIERQDCLEKLRGQMLVIFELEMVSMEVKVFLVGMIVLYQKKSLLVRLLSLGHLEYMSVKSMMVSVR